MSKNRNVRCYEALIACGFSQESALKIAFLYRENYPASFQAETHLYLMKINRK